MAKATFIDAQFVVALVNRRDQFHDIATELSKEYVGRPLITTEAVLIEICNSLARNFKPEAVEIIESFHRAVNVEIVPLTTTVFLEGFELYKSHVDKSWGITDCISFMVMRREGVHEALTCDRHFSQAGFSALMYSKPS